MKVSGKIQRIAAKRYWRASDAEVLLKAQRSSGMSIGAFSRELGCKAERLACWQRKFKIKSEEDLSFPEFMQIEVKARTEVRELDIVVGNIIVRVKEDFDNEMLRRVVSILGERC